MRKISLVLALTLLLAFPVVTTAANFDITGGFTYNTYAAIEYNSRGEQVDDYTELKSRTGYFGEGIYWLNETFGLGIRLEVIESVGIDHKINIFTPYANLV